MPMWIPSDEDLEAIQDMYEEFVPIIEALNERGWENISETEINNLLIKIAERMENETIDSDNIIEEEEIERKIYDKGRNLLETQKEIEEEYVNEEGNIVKETIKDTKYYNLDNLPSNRNYDLPK